MKEYTLENSKIRVTFLDYGGIITSIIKKKNDTNFVLTYSDYSFYKANPYYLGATIGRTSGRTYPPNYVNYKGQVIDLDINEGNLNIHGGFQGLDKKYWKVERISKEIYELTYIDNNPKYEEMKLKIHYKLMGNTFVIEYFGKSEEQTVCNITNHTYFNLNKDKSQGIENHWLQMSHSSLQIIDEFFIPTEEYSDMQSDSYEEFNFSSKKQIKTSLGLQNKLSKICADGIDLAYIFKTDQPEIVLQSDNKENTLRITTDRECVVVYTMNKISEKLKIKNGDRIAKYGGITFEVQERPNYLHTTKAPLVKDYHSLTKYSIE